MTAYIFLYVGSITSLGIGAFLFLISGCRDVMCNLTSINKMAKSKRHHLKCLKHISAFIRLHSDMKQLCDCNLNKFYFQNSFINGNRNFFYCCFRLVRDFSKFWQPIFLTLFAWSLISICGTMLMIQIEIVQYFCSFMYTNCQT